MQINEYQEKAMSTCLPESDNMLYMLFGLTEETGELMGKFSKAIRHGTLRFDGNQMRLNMSNQQFQEFMDAIEGELGDVMWMCAGVAHVLGIDLEYFAKKNLEKLASRKKRNVIDGAGDNR